MGEAKRRQASALKTTTKDKAPTPAEINRIITLFNMGHHAELEIQAHLLVERYPHSGFAWKALGLSLQLQGKDALPALQKATELLPDDAEAHNNLGSALNDLGQFEDAAASFSRALEIKPDYAMAHCNLGNVLQDLGQIEGAVASYCRALEIEPNFAGAHNNLGSVLIELGQFDDAMASCRRALEIEPNYAEAHNNLGNALRNLGQLDNAVASYRRALDVRPDFAEAHNNLGITMAELGLLDDAAASCLRALKIKPDFAEGYSNMGFILTELGRFDTAITSYRHALEIRPDFAEAHKNLGATLKMIGKFDDAVMHFRQALDIKPGYSDALIAMGSAVADRGQFAEAEAYFQRVLMIEPENPEAWASITSVRKMASEDTDWLATAEKIVAQNLRPRHESFLRYAMGKYCDDTKDFEQAFLNYHRANELKKSFGKKYDRQQQTALADHLIRVYHRDMVNQVSVGASSSERPLFIVGMPRSGTSLTEQIVASHPAVFGAGELRFWDSAVQKHKLDTLDGGLNEALLRDLAEECLRNLSGYSVDALRVADKMPGNFIYLGLIHTVFPNARILHIRRNPIDTCLSIYFQNFHASIDYANDLEDLAHYYREYHRLMAHWREILPSEVFLDIPYEALVEDQEGWSRKIIELIGLEWDERCLDFHKTERKVSTASNWQARQKIYKTSKERWRHYEKYVGPLQGLLKL